MLLLLGWSNTGTGCPGSAVSVEPLSLEILKTGGTTPAPALDSLQLKAQPRFLKYLSPRTISSTPAAETVFHQGPKST